MGSWNGTCAISNLPIEAGTPIKLVILRRQRFGKIMKPSSGYVYSTDIFAPAFLAIEGKYNDYGGIEDIVEDWNSKLIPVLLQMLFEKMKCEGNEIKKADFALEPLLEGIERNEFEVFSGGDKMMKRRAVKAWKLYKDDKTMKAKTKQEWKTAAEVDISPQWKSGPYSSVMIRKDVWDHILKNSGDDQSYYDRASPSGYITGKEHFKRSFDKTVAHLKIEDEFETMKDSAGREALSYMFSQSGYAGGNGYDAGNGYTAALEGLIKLGREQEFFGIWSEQRLIENFMSGIRKGWMPQAGSGSQHSGWEDHKILADITTSVCNKQLEQIRKWEEEDELEK